MRVVIIGSAGRLGEALSKALSSQHEIIEMSRKEIDLSDSDSIRRVLEPLLFSHVIICAALTAVDYCESNIGLAMAVNADGPTLIAKIAATKGAHVTYISTDFVFDGSSPLAYAENEIARPISVYGTSKLAGEKGVTKASDLNLIIRISWLFGSGKPAFPEWVINQAMTRSAVSLPSDKVGSPTFTEDLIQYMRPLLGLNGSSARQGTFHLANSGACTWQEWGQYCIDIAHEKGLPLRTLQIEAASLGEIEAFIARRPVNSALNIGKYCQAVKIVPRNWRMAVRDYLTSSNILENLRQSSQI